MRTISVKHWHCHVNLPLGDNNGAAGLPATDAEGRALVAKFVAGGRNPGGPNVALTEEEVDRIHEIYQEAFGQALEAPR